MATLIIVTSVLLGLYLFIESLAALNDMEKACLKKIHRELLNPYTIKYWGTGIVGLGLVAFCLSVDILHIAVGLALAPWLAPRTLYRLRQRNTLECDS